ncbi:MFS transporter [Streptomyces sp. NPDC057302]|uniref:MFS transporter n=1 Tax=Streptomyces sp. NPDC057302 TaxID=3346094 RepID=UPI00363C80E6
MSVTKWSRDSCRPPQFAHDAAPGANEVARRDLGYYLASVVVRTLGMAFTSVALPLFALIHLRATVVEMSLLVAAGTAPSVVTALVAGALVDRYRRLPLLVWGRAAGAAILAVVPLAAMTGALSMPILYGVALLLAAVNDVVGTASVSYPPMLVRQEQLAQVNARVWELWACAQTAGKPLAVGLIAIAGPCWAVAVDVVAYLVSAVCITRIQTAEPQPQPRERGSTVWGETKSGLRYTRADPIMWRLLLCTTVMRVSLTAWDTLLLVLLVQHLHYSAVTVGLVVGCGGIGGLVGAKSAPRWGDGPLMQCALAILPLAMLLVLLVLLVGTGPAVPYVIGAAVAVWTAAAVAYGSKQRFVCQGRCSPEYQGRLQSVSTWITLTPCAVAVLAAGQLVELVGLRPAMAFAAVTAVSAFALVRSPARHLRDSPSRNMAKA